MMSGCPGAPGDSHANWITTEWPPEVRDVLRWQWDDVLIPYWRDLVAYAREQGVDRLCLELHGHQNVYNVATLKRLRDAVGETVGANLDPSHLMWMGADPLAAAHALGDAIYYVHAKDTRIDPVNAGVNGVIDTTPGSDFQARAWSYITLGLGHDEAWWRAFVAALAAAGYDGVLSIEHEDPAMSAEEGVEKSVALLRRVIVKRPRASRSSHQVTATLAATAHRRVRSRRRPAPLGSAPPVPQALSPATSARWRSSSPTCAPSNGTSGRMPAAPSPRRTPSSSRGTRTRRISSRRSAGASTR